MKRVYLAGPMRGIPEYNFPAFRAAATELRHLGYEVFSPAEKDEEDGFNPKTDVAKTLAHYMLTDLPAVLERDAVVVLEGWEGSQGACLEVHVGHTCGKEIIRYITMAAMTTAEINDALGTVHQPAAYHVTAADVGEGREVKPEFLVTGFKADAGKPRHDLIPPEVLDALAQVLTRGAEKYQDRNWEKGMLWSRPYAAAMRHMLAWWGGEELDPEFGYHHLAHAMCCLTFLLTYDSDGFFKHLDDRPATFRSALLLSEGDAMAAGA